jgi:hypothetical protein
MIKQGWYCDLCGMDTTYICAADTDSLRVKEAVLAQHRLNSPECPANDLGPIRFRDRHTAKD